MQLTITPLSAADTVLVHVPCDQLTHENALAFDNALDAVLEQSQNTILDLEQVDFMDSMVMKKLLKSQQRINKRNGHLVFVRLSPTVNALFELIGLSDILTVQQDVESAMDFLQAQRNLTPAPVSNPST
jgi:anti-anti-sigma factor